MGSTITPVSLLSSASTEYSVTTPSLPGSLNMKDKLWESDIKVYKKGPSVLNIVAGCRAVCCERVAACSAASPIIIRGASHLVTTRGAKPLVMLYGSSYFAHCVSRFAY